MESRREIIEGWRDTDRLKKIYLGDRKISSTFQESVWGMKTENRKVVSFHCEYKQNVGNDIRGLYYY